jgi:hypothetical protein
MTLSGSDKKRLNLYLSPNTFYTCDSYDVECAMLLGDDDTNDNTHDYPLELMMIAADDDDKVKGQTQNV